VASDAADCTPVSGCASLGLITNASRVLKSSVNHERRELPESSQVETRNFSRLCGLYSRWLFSVVHSVVRFSEVGILFEQALLTLTCELRAVGFPVDLNRAT
jgi:hypothetical protein